MDEDGDVLVVLCCAANHGRATNVDVLDGVGQGATGLGDCGGERIEVDHDHVDWLDTVLRHDVAIEVATTEDTTVDLRMQGLDPAVHHFRKTGVVGYFNSLDALFAQQLVGATGGEDFNALGGKLAGKVDDASLVGNADQCAAYRQAGSLICHLGSRLGSKNQLQATSLKLQVQAILAGSFRAVRTV